LQRHKRQFGAPRNQIQDGQAATLRLQATGLMLSPYLIGWLTYACRMRVIVSLRESRNGGMPAELVSVFGRRR
jgi:hypothetical protein